MKKVLVITPRSPFKNRGTDEQERVYAIKWLIAEGYQVRVITKVMESDLPTIEEAKNGLGIAITPVSYKFRNRKEWFKRIFNPLYWDGASYEYFEPEIQATLKGEIDEFEPDLVWIDYVYLWPLCNEVRKRKIPIIIRSLNFEALHVIEEEGFTLINILLFFPKLLSEWFASRKSNIVFTLNPNEVRWYRRIGAQVELLPLRFLWEKFKRRGVNSARPLQVLFMGSSYNLSHNLKSFEFVAKELAPELSKSAPGEFVFHVTGSKFPAEHSKFVDGTTVIYDGYVPIEKMDEYLDSMDVVIVPAVKRVGMQGKVFEPMARGMVVLTSKENLVGYPFKEGIDVVCAENKHEYINKLLDLRDPHLRQVISNNVSELSKKLFSREDLDKVVRSALNNLIT
jgi:hypothetical protein